MEQIDYNLLFRWFVGLPMDAEVWHPTVFTKNRDRLLEADVAREFLAALLGLARVKRLLSDEHFTVDGTLIDAWASMKSFRPKDGSGDPNTKVACRGGRMSRKPDPPRPPGGRKPRQSPDILSPIPVRYHRQDQPGP